MHIVPDTQEAEVGRLLGPRFEASLGNIARTYLKKTKQTENGKTIIYTNNAQVSSFCFLSFFLSGNADK
jgi:hypothetical protein